MGMGGTRAGSSPSLHHCLSSLPPPSPRGLCPEKQRPQGLNPRRTSASARLRRPASRQPPQRGARAPRRARTPGPAAPPGRVRPPVTYACSGPRCRRPETKAARPRRRRLLGAALPGAGEAGGGERAEPRAAAARPSAPPRPAGRPGRVLPACSPADLPRARDRPRGRGRGGGRAGREPRVCVCARVFPLNRDPLPLPASPCGNPVEMLGPASPVPRCTPSHPAVLARLSSAPATHFTKNKIETWREGQVPQAQG